ncbi:MAG: hypothetical protein WCK14_03885 [Actinomycetota bacterium]
MVTEEIAEMVDDNFETSALTPRHKAALAFSDAFFAAAGPPHEAAQAAISAQFSDAELAEMGIGLALFHGFSKLLIALGAEPEQMDITMLRTPGSPSEK